VRQQYDKVVINPTRFVQCIRPSYHSQELMLKTCSTEDLWKLTVTEAFKRFKYNRIIWKAYRGNMATKAVKVIRIMLPAPDLIVALPS
jgi:hypothetical protein